MKSVFIAAVSSVIVFSLASFCPAAKPERSLVTISTQNGTNFNGNLEMSGASYLTFDFQASTSQVAGQVNTGTYTVTISCAAPGTHTYMFTGGYTKSSNTGSAVFTGVNVTSNSSATVY